MEKGRGMSILVLVGGRSSVAVENVMSIEGDAMSIKFRNGKDIG